MLNDRHKFVRLAQFKKRAGAYELEEYFYNGYLVNSFTDIHKDAVLDLVEIVKPLLVATASIDKWIRFISLKDKKLIGKFGGHIQGVRQLDYTTFEEGYMVSVGYETTCNFWTFEGGLGSI